LLLPLRCLHHARHSLLVYHVCRSFRPRHIQIVEWVHILIWELLIPATDRLLSPRHLLMVRSFGLQDTTINSWNNIVRLRSRRVQNRLWVRHELLVRRKLLLLMLLLRLVRLTGGQEGFRVNFCCWIHHVSTRRRLELRCLRVSITYVVRHQLLLIGVGGWRNNRWIWLWLL
jgi:hypothetical protein